VKDIASVERFATPQRTLFMEKAGDCDDSSIALSALLESIGHETRLILIDPDLSGRFTHVIAQAKIGDKWYWMETTKKVPFGWTPGYSISHIIDKKSPGEKDMKALDNLFSLGDIGRRGGGGRGGGSRSSSRPASRSSKPSVISRLRSSASRAVAKAAKVHSAAVKRTTGAARSRLTGIAQRAKSIRQNIARKAGQAKRAVSERIKRRAGSLRSELVKRRDSVMNRFKKGMIGKSQAKNQIQSLKAKAAAAAKKMRDEKVKAIAPIVAFEAKKEEEIAEKQAELEKEVVESAPPEEMVQPEQGEEEQVQEEAQEESFEPERDEEAGKEETEGEEAFEPQETEDETGSEPSCDECGIEEFCPPKKTGSWRKFPDHKSETRAVKEALRKAGIEAEVGHGRGTAWGWLEINIGDPRMRNGLKPPPFEYQYSEEEQALHNKVLKIAQEVTGRHGDYDGRISLLAQGWRKKPKREDKAEKEKVSIEGVTVHPVKIIPEIPISIPEEEIPATRSEPKAKPPLEVKPAIYTRKHKRAARKPDIVYTEYGRTVVKKAKSGTIRLTDSDMRADAIYISY
jgi:hypothetical protein